MVPAVRIGGEDAMGDYHDDLIPAGDQLGEAEASTARLTMAIP